MLHDIKYGCFYVPKKQNTCHKLQADGATINYSKDLLQVWVSHFESLSQSKANHHPSVQQQASELLHLEACSHMYEDSILDTDISVNEVANAIGSPKSGRADDLDPEHLKYGGYALHAWLLGISLPFSVSSQFHPLSNWVLLFQYTRGRVIIHSIQTATGGLHSPLSSLNVWKRYYSIVWNYHLEKSAFFISHKLRISDQCHVQMPYFRHRRPSSGLWGKRLISGISLYQASRSLYITLPSEIPFSS